MKSRSTARYKSASSRTLWNFAWRSFLLRLRIKWNRSEPVFIQRPTSSQRAAAHLDVVFLVPGEISERKRVFRRRDHSQIALNSRTQPHARFGRAFCDNGFNQRMGNEELRNGFRFLCRHQQIEIVDNLFSSSITPGNLNLQCRFVRSEIGTQRFRLSG